MRWAATGLACLPGLWLATGATAQVRDVPENLGDGWAVAAPASQGMDGAALNALSQRIERGELGAIHSFLVVRHGYLVFERYYQPRGMWEIHTVQSVTKSVASALVGIAIDEGLIEGVDVPLEKLFPEYRDVFEKDPRKKQIRLRDVLTMSMGIDWNENAYPYSDPRNVVWQLATAPDWMRYVLERPMVETPGTRFNYCSGASVLLSGILQNATGMHAQEYAEKRLFDPLEVPVHAWYRNTANPMHWTHTGGGLNIRARDLAKFAYLYINGGAWHGEQVVPQAWIEETVKPRLNAGEHLSYGYQWWLRPLDRNGDPRALSNDIRHAWGWGGQYAFTIPSLDLVVVFTSGEFDDRPKSLIPIDLLYDNVIPAVVDRPR